MLALLAKALLFSGACILIIALVRAKKMVALLPLGSTRNKWIILTGLISFFIVGYLGYNFFFWNSQQQAIDLLVPIIFFFGSGFVWLTMALSVQTVTDLQRVTHLEHENITDPLTGIYNRRFLDNRMQEEIARAQRYNLPLSILLLDADHFKRVNDTFGHQAGDLVLQHLCRMILDVLRSSDIAVRYGGEEILIIASNTALDTASKLAERLRSHIEAQAIDIGNKQQVNITVSVGVAELSQDTADDKSLLKNADQALYHAKKLGRNRVVVHGKKQESSLTKVAQ